MRELRIFQVDAFTDRPLRGNPAAVCPLGRWLPDAQLQAIACEMNLSETAFFVPRGDDYELRWFTPAVEVPLCGHATLAAALVLLRELQPARASVVFHSRSGPLPVSRRGHHFVLDFPAHAPAARDEPAGLATALGTAVTEVLQADRLLAVVADASTVRTLRPNMLALAELPAFGVCVTAQGGSGADADVDFVSRYFAPRRGIAEDPVTGAAHCVLAPFWAQRLGKTRLKARQVSARGGELECELAGDRVRLLGQAALVMRGTLYL